MGIESDFSGGDRDGATPGEKSGLSGLKLVSGRPGATQPPAPTDGMAGDMRDRDAGIGDGRSGEQPTTRRSGHDASAPARSAERPTGSGFARRLPAWSFLVLLLIFLFAYGHQAYRSRQLEEQVASLESSLAQAEGRLESQRSRLSEIRSGVHELADRFRALQALVDEDPTSAEEAGLELPPEVLEAP